MEPAEPGPRQNIARLSIPSFAEDSRIPLLQPPQELPIASLYSGPTSIRALATIWALLLPTGGLCL